MSVKYLIVRKVLLGLAVSLVLLNLYGIGKELSDLETKVDDSQKIHEFNNQKWIFLVQCSEFTIGSGYTAKDIFWSETVQEPVCVLQNKHQVYLIKMSDVLKGLKGQKPKEFEI